MAHNNNPPRYNELHEPAAHEYVQPKLEQQPYVLPFSSYGEATSSSKQQSEQQAGSLLNRSDTLFASMTNGFFGTSFVGSSSNAALDSRHSNDADKPDNVQSLNVSNDNRFNDRTTQEQQNQRFSYFHASDQSNFEGQQVFRAENAPTWFSWLPSASAASMSGEQPIFVPRTANYVSDNNTVLINTLLDSANMSGLPVDINSAYEANRIQIQDVYRAVEFEMHRRLTVPHSNSEPILDNSDADNNKAAKSLPAFAQHSPPSTSQCATTSTTRSSQTVNRAEHEDPAAWFSMWQRRKGLTGETLSSPQQVLNDPTDFFGASSQSAVKLGLLSDKNQATSGNAINDPPTAHATANLLNDSRTSNIPPVFLLPPSASNANSNTSTSNGKLNEYINVEQIMRSQQPTTTGTFTTTTIAEKKPFQKPLHQIPTSPQRRSSTTTPLSSAPKKRTAVFSQFTGVDAPTIVSQKNNADGLGSPVVLKKIKTEANSSLSETAGNSSGADDDEYAEDDASEHSYSDLSDGRAVAAVLAPLARTGNADECLPASNSTDARDNVLVCYTFWRLALVKKVRREVTLGEIRRRLAPPESFTLSQLGSLLRLAKVRGSGPALKQRLEHYGLKVESSQRTQARQTLFMALLESEANTMANEYKTLCLRHFPRRSLAEYFVHKRHSEQTTSALSNKTANTGSNKNVQYSTYTSAFPQQTNASSDSTGKPSEETTNTGIPATMPDKADDLIACADTLAELRTVLLLDRSPLMASEPSTTNNQRLPSTVQTELNNFSASTHGFGTQTIVQHIALLEDVLKYMARCYAAPVNTSATCMRTSSASLMNDFEPENPMLAHQLQPLSQQQHW